MNLPVRPDVLLDAYKQGLFPMAEHAKSDEVQWIQPHQRGQLSISEMHIPRSLKKIVKRGPFTVRINHDFHAVIKACAAISDERTETWINPLIIDLFCELHAQGHAHSVECWDGETLVGGLYGLALGQVFCGESMFSKQSNASKIALVHLAARLWRGGFQVLDTQFTNEHLEQFGVYEVSHEAYLDRLRALVEKPADFILKEFSEERLVQEYFAHREDLLRR